MIAAVKDKYNLPQFKIFAPQNKLFSTYIDNLCDKKSAEFREYKELETEAMKDALNYIEQNKKKLSNIDKRGIQIDVKYRFMFHFIGKKLEYFSKG